jgi:hypothetical protein
MLIGNTLSYDGVDTNSCLISPFSTDTNIQKQTPRFGGYPLQTSGKNTVHDNVPVMFWSTVP